MPTTWTNGTRNGRRRSGSVYRSTITPMQTSANANSVPMFVRSYVSPASPISDQSATNDAGEQRRRVRHARLAADPRRPLRQQAVARHREEDARLAVLEHEQHGRHREHGAERDDLRDARHAGRFERVRERIGRLAEVLRRHHAREHGADDDVDDRTDREPAEDADRQVALRVLRFLGGRRDGVEADVGEEDDRRALVNAAEAVRRERVVVRRC